MLQNEDRFFPSQCGVSGKRERTNIHVQSYHRSCASQGGSGNGGVDPETLTTKDKNSEDEVYVDILRKLKAFVRLRIRHMGHFPKLLGFMTFCLLYCAMLYLQMEPILSYEVSSSVKGLLHPRIKSTQDARYIYDWLTEHMAEPLWTEAPCRDSVCQAPYEFPAFGRFGCKADCGMATNLITLVIHIQSRFGNSLSISGLELMSQTSWNLCHQDPGRFANDLPDLCWYEKEQKFTELSTNTLVRLDVISGYWYVRLKGDYLGLVGGKIYRIEEGSGDLILTPTVPLWLTCTKNSLFKRVTSRVTKFPMASTQAARKKNLSGFQDRGKTGKRKHRFKRFETTVSKHISFSPLNLPSIAHHLHERVKKNTTETRVQRESEGSRHNKWKETSISTSHPGRRNLLAE